MNQNKNVVVFTLVFTSILFLYSLSGAVFQAGFFACSNISIISDVIKITGKSPDTIVAASADSIVEKPADTIANGLPEYPRATGRYSVAGRITSFYTDSTIAALPALMKKLYALKNGKKRKVRIAWLGDSMIEGDLLTQTFRKKIQQLFGGFGVGFVQATSVSAPFRTTVTHTWSGDWKEENFKTKELNSALFISGHVFYTANGALHLKDMTVKDTMQVLEKSLICGPAASGANITVNNLPRQIFPTKRINRILLDSSSRHAIDLAIFNDKLPVYGVSIEPATGVVVDNFSFRGITGLELNKLDINLLHEIQEETPYDLVILEYGANLMFRPEDTDYSWFQKHIIPVIKKIESAMPGAEFLIISTSDRAFKYGDNWSTAVGINNLIKSQAELAYTTKSSFYNMYESMGGYGTIVKWAEQAPSLANKDYIHPNQRGAEVLGNLFFQSFIKDYEKAQLYVPEEQCFEATAYQTIFDKKTGLEWYIAEDKNMTWNDAVNWVSSLDIDNGTWSMPTTAQVLKLYDKNSSAGIGYEREGKKYTAKINHIFNKIGHGAWVWTKEDINAEEAYSVNLSEGLKIVSQKNKIHYPIRALAVRQINKQKL